MSIATTPDAEILAIPSFPVRRFSVEEYHRLGAAGILSEDDRVELLEGLIVPKMNRNPPHDCTIATIDNLLRRKLSDAWHLRTQFAITTIDSEPEPDLAITRGSILDFYHRHPGPSEIALVVEVADSSLSRDRAKCRVYARAGIVCYWIVNLVEQVVEVYSQPQHPTGSSPAYAHCQKFVAGQTISLVLDGAAVAEIAVADLLL